MGDVEWLSRIPSRWELKRLGQNSWMAKKYGRIPSRWELKPPQTNVLKPTALVEFHPVGN